MLLTVVAVVFSILLCHLGLLLHIYVSLGLGEVGDELASHLPVVVRDQPLQLILHGQVISQDVRVIVDPIMALSEPGLSLFLLQRFIPKSWFEPLQIDSLHTSELLLASILLHGFQHGVEVSFRLRVQAHHRLIPFVLLSLGNALFSFFNGFLVVWDYFLFFEVGDLPGNF